MREDGSGDLRQKKALHSFSRTSGLDAAHLLRLRNIICNEGQYVSRFGSIRRENCKRLYLQHLPLCMFRTVWQESESRPPAGSSSSWNFGRLHIVNSPMPSLFAIPDSVMNAVAAEEGVDANNGRSRGIGGVGFLESMPRPTSGEHAKLCAYLEL